MQTSELLKIFTLAKLTAPENVETISGEFEAVVGFAGAVSSADLSGADLSETDEIYPLRPDEVMPGADRDLILSNAGESVLGYFAARGKGGAK